MVFAALHSTACITTNTLLSRLQTLLSSVMLLMGSLRKFKSDIMELAFKIIF